MDERKSNLPPVEPELKSDTIQSILTFNGGSSSIKFPLYQVEDPLERRLRKVDRIGLSGTNLKFNEPTGNQQDSYSIASSDHKSAANFLIGWLQEQNSFESVQAVGHRMLFRPPVISASFSLALSRTAGGGATAWRFQSESSGATANE